MADKVKVTVKNTGDAVHVFTDVVAGSVELKPGETKEFECSEAAKAELEARSERDDDPLELTTKAAAKKEEAAVEKAEADASKAEKAAVDARAKAAAKK